MANITKVYLLSVPLDMDYNHTLYFANATDQHSFFEKKVQVSYTDFTYQRKDSTIRVNAHVDTLYRKGCNYVMYQNPGYGDKWFYAFITGMEYKNEDVTVISITTDVMQTWMFDITINKCFVEREHAADDTEGLHTIPENLEIGEYVTKYNSKMNDLLDLSLVMGVTSDPEGTPATGSTLHGIYTGVDYIIFRSGQTGDIQRFIESYAGRTDSIKTLFIAPTAMADRISNESITSGYYNKYHMVGSMAPKTLTTSMSKHVGEYSPKNKKLNCFPYRYLLVSNNAGGAAIYHYEYFSGEMMQFKCYCVLTPGCAIRLVPLNYKGLAENNEEGLNLGKFPICNWTSDEYTNWLTQNSVNIGVNLIASGAEVITGAALAIGSGGVMGTGQVVSGAVAIGQQLGQIHQMKFVAPQANGNINCGDAVTASNNNTFTFYGMAIKDEYLQVIDEYFSMYGYKCHRVKYPARNHRAAYWYTKTIEANIFGKAPQEDLQKIKDCYNKGITFWRSSAPFRDYTADNPTV